jgi:hypothetical protein
LLETTEAFLLESGVPASQLRTEPIRKNVSPKNG